MHKQFKKIFLFANISVGVFFPLTSTAFMCPTNFNQAEIGQTIAEVTQACGKPDFQEDSKRANDNVPQEWTYYISSPAYTSTGTASNFNQLPIGSLKTTIGFDASGKVINISVNGVAQGVSTICGSNIQLSDTKETIRKVCGDPAFVQKQESNEPATPENDKSANVVKFTYKSDPPVQLIFENGILVEQR